jgi:serine/threonine-protein kinase
MIQTVLSSLVERILSNKLVTREQLQRSIAVAGDDDKALTAHLVREKLLTPFQARQLLAGSASLAVGNYTVVDFIGRGGSGLVLKAYHRLMPGRFVALKTIDTRNLHADADMIERFKREIEIVSKFDHPNVVRAFDVIQTRTQLYLVLEYVAGRDLGQIVHARGPLPVAEAVDYALQAARGLAYAHHLGIVHRDLKPTNLLLTDDRIVKIADMGLARRLGNGALTEASLKGQALGTPDYMAPEQAEDATAAGPRSDLYSLGATLFHLLTATPSIEGSSYIHKLQLLLSAPARPLAETRTDVPAGLAQVVDRLRARRPEDRPATAEEAIALLEPFGPAAPPAPRKPEPGELAEAVLQVLLGKDRAEVVCARYGLSTAEFDNNQQQFITGGKRAFDPQQQPVDNDEAVQKLHAKIGAQQMEIEDLKRQLRAAIPSNGRSRGVSATGR